MSRIFIPTHKNLTSHLQDAGGLRMGLGAENNLWGDVEDEMMDDGRSLRITV